jgi:hypothetical protein
VELMSGTSRRFLSHAAAVQGHCLGREHRLGSIALTQLGLARKTDDVQRRMSLTVSSQHLMRIHGSKFWSTALFVLWLRRPCARMKLSSRMEGF